MAKPPSPPQLPDPLNDPALMAELQGPGPAPAGPMPLPAGGGEPDPIMLITAIRDMAESLLQMAQAEEEPPMGGAPPIEG